MTINKRGISLIVLVITIIVIVILAVAVILTISNNNPIQNANKAKANNNNSVLKEEVTLLQANWLLMSDEEKLQNTDGDKKFSTYANKELNNLGFHTSGEGSIEVTDTGIIYEYPKIPSGFVASPYENEKKISDGLVIYELKDGEDKIPSTETKEQSQLTRNQFVWIGVPKDVTSNANTTEEIYNSLDAYCVTYRAGWNDEWYDRVGIDEKTYNDLKAKVLLSIKENGGFFVGRYEVGSDIYRTSAKADEVPMYIKRDLYVYNYVSCRQSQVLAMKFYEKKENVNRTLMFGIQWHLIMKFFENTLSYEELAENEGFNWGNYFCSPAFTVQRGSYSLDHGVTYTKINNEYTIDGKQVFLTTGASDRNMKYNIYDLAGNIWEWTLEKPSISAVPCSRRGGSCGSGWPVAIRRASDNDNAGDDRGFRIVIF